MPNLKPGVEDQGSTVLSVSLQGQLCGIGSGEEE